MESEGSFYRSRVVPSCVGGSENHSNSGLKYSGISNSEQFMRKCSLCTQGFYGLSNHFNFESDLDCLCAIFIAENGSKTGYNLCDHCGTLLNNLVRARDILLEYFNDLISTAGRWIPEVERSQIIVRLLNYSAGKNSLEDEDYARGSIELLSEVNHEESQDSQEGMSIPELIPGIELSNVSSVENELSQENLVIRIDHPAPVPLSSVEKNSTIKSDKRFQVEESGEVRNSLLIGPVEDDDMLEDVLSSQEDGRVFLPSLCGKDEKQNSGEVFNPSSGNGKEIVKKKKARKSYSCSICSRNCKTTRELELHMGVHLQERKFICEVCGLAYRHKKALEVHVGLHRGEAKFECEHCHKVFTQKSGLQRHLPIHTGEMAYQCDICGKRFLYNTSFNVHKFTHTKHKEFQCFECGLSFFSKSHLKRHMKTHTGVKPHVCENCGKRFSERYNLDAHMRIHTGQKSHKCPHCDHGFNRKGKLEAHILQKHSQISSNA